MQPGEIIVGFWGTPSKSVLLVRLLDRLIRLDLSCLDGVTLFSLRVRSVTYARQTSLLIDH